MREIKFRGKHLADGSWVYGYLYEANDCAWIIQEQGMQTRPNTVDGPAEYDSEPVWFEVDPDTIAQYTGLEDKNGVRIYGDDIYRHKNQYYDQTHVVKWVAKQAGFNIDSRYLDEIEVIGNTTDNPELVK